VADEKEGVMKFRNSYKRRDPKTGQKKLYPSDKTDLSHDLAQEVVLTGVGDVHLSGFDHIVATQKISAPRTVEQETWIEYFGLKFYRFRQWFQKLWATARLGRNSGWGWLLASRNQNRL